MLVILGLMAGCSDSSAPRNVLVVYSINNYNALSSDVRNVGDDRLANTGDDFVYEDQVAIVVESNKHDDVVDVGYQSPYEFVRVERFEVRYEAEGHEIPGWSGGLGWTIQSAGVLNATLTVVPAWLKQNPPLSGLVSGGEIVATAHITFHGRESTSNAPVTFTATLPVHFANWVDL